MFGLPEIMVRIIVDVVVLVVVVDVVVIVRLFVEMSIARGANDKVVARVAERANDHGVHDE